MAFRFSLEAVLRVARARESCEWAKLVAIRTDVNACTAELQTVLAAQNTARKQMLEQAATAVCAAWLQTIGEAIARLQQREREIRDALVALDGRVKAQQTQYVAERQKREVLSKVKETRYAEFVRKVGRQEQIVLDDMFLARRK